MSIRGLDHLALTVADVDRTLAFYRRVLGAEVLYEELWRAGKIPVAVLQVGASRLTVHDAAKPAKPNAAAATPGSADVCFRFDGPLEEATAHLASQGVEVVEAALHRSRAGPLSAVKRALRSADRNGMRALSALLFLASLALAGPLRAEETTLSLLAFGDAGKPASWPTTFLPQYRVGEAMAREDRRSPVQALLILGDIFYPDGLTRRTLRERLRMNLAGPYCHFLSPTRKGRRAVRGSCDLPPERTHPVPIIAVTGNHDLGRNQGVRLQRERLPVFLENWLMPAEARSYELGAGVSVVGFHSDTVNRGAPATALEAALRASKGPWRIVIAHHPLADPGAGWRDGYAERVLAAIDAAGKPVHLFLAGHQHSLQALRGAGAALHVVSGAGGASIRPLSPAGDERLYGVAAYGFVRIDVSPEALDVSFLALDGIFDRDAELEARYRVAPDGSVSSLGLE